MSDPTRNEKYCQLPGGRKLAYTEAGDTTSSTLVIFFHGVFGVGDASHPSRVLQHVHFVAPTVPGWGNSSPMPPLSESTSYASAFASIITTLIDHLHPNEPNLKLYVSGGSYGTVHAQILYGAPFDVFPYGRRMAGCLIMAPFSPFKHHTDYAKTMTTPNYISIGPPSQLIPFRLVQRLISVALKTKLSSVERAEGFIKGSLINTMDDKERAAFEKWRIEAGRADGEAERNMAENVVKSVQNGWHGFLEVSDVIHGDWGFRPDALDGPHTRRPILIVTSEGDTTAPDTMAKWLAARYRNSRLKTVWGGHLAVMPHLDEIWKEVLEGSRYP